MIDGEVIEGEDESEYTDDVSSTGSATEPCL
jgi:hypothetical protein